MSHPDLEGVDSWVASMAEDPGSLDLLRHLLDCPSCAARVQDRLNAPSASEPHGSSIDYSQIWSRVLDRARSAEARARRVRGQALDRVEELLATPPASRLERVRRERRFAHRAIAEQALATIRSQPERMEDLARIALAITEGLPERRHLTAVRVSLLASARCHLAEALRAEGLLDRAESELEKVALPTELSDALERARYCRVLGAVRRDRGRLDEALALFGRAVDLYEDLSEVEALAEVRLALGSLYLELFDARRARAVFESVLHEPQQISRAHIARAIQGRVLALLLADGTESALSALDEVAASCPWEPESTEALSLLALRGRVELSAGHTEAARDALTRALQGLSQCGAALEAAHAGAALALLYLRQNESPKERLDLADLLDMLSTSGVPFEVELSLVGLRNGLRQGSLPPRRLRHLLAAIEHYRDIDPSRYFSLRRNMIH